MPSAAVCRRRRISDLRSIFLSFLFVVSCFFSFFRYEEGKSADEWQHQHQPTARLVDSTLNSILQYDGPINQSINQSIIMMKCTTRLAVSFGSKRSASSCRPSASLLSSTTPMNGNSNINSNTTTTTTTRSHYSYASPGHFHGGGWSSESLVNARDNWKQRGFTVGIGGPVGSGKTALVLALTRRLAEKVPRE
jgi:hypothetical protein